MDFIEPTPEIAPFGLRAMAMVARASENGLGATQRVLLDAAQRVILHTEIDIDSLPPITPEELAQKFDDPAIARQLIRGMVIMSLAEGPASPRQTELISTFAAALGVKEPAVKVIRELTEGDILMFRLDFYRRSHLRDYMRTQYKLQGGFLGMAKAVLGVTGMHEDEKLAGRFRALGDLPENTLGHHLFLHYTSNGFAFPGEKGGFPMGAMFHDIGHVLGGYDTTPEGELRVSAFQAGYRRNEDAFFTILFAVLIHTAGVNMAPIKMPVLLGRIAQGELFEEIVTALKRGGSMTTDLGDAWDFWPYMDLPLDLVRERLGVPPLVQDG